MRRLKILKAFPSNLQIQTTSYCNYNCIICPYHKVKDNFQQGIMSEVLFDKIVDEIEENNIYIYNIFLVLMNEPLLDITLHNKIEKIKKKIPKAKVIIISNGTLLNETISNNLINASLDTLKISINGFYLESYIKDKNYDQINKVVNNIDNFIKWNKGRVKLIISLVNNRLNEQLLVETFYKWRKFKNVSVVISPFSNRTGMVDGFEEFSCTKDSIYSFGSKCTIPFSFFNILYDGTVILCCNDWNRKAVLGNLNNENISTIWHNKFIKSYRDELVYNTYHNTEPCSNCMMS